MLGPEIPDQATANEDFFRRSREEWEELGGFPWPSQQEGAEVTVAEADAHRRAMAEAHEEWLQREFEADLRASGRMV